MRAVTVVPVAALLALGHACGRSDEQSPSKPDAEHKIAPHWDIPVVDEGKAKADAGIGQPQCPHSAPQPPAAAAPASPQFGTEQERGVVRGWIRRLMDETRVVPATQNNPGGPRGSAGSFDKLSGAQVEEFVSAIIYGAKKFLPQGLIDQERWALVCAEISIESAFTPGTRGVNPGDNSKVSVSPLQITVRGNPAGPGMWEDIFVQYANLPDLVHADGSHWDTKSTTADQLEHSIFDGIIASLWCITEQGRRGCPDWFGQSNDGPCPKTMHTAFLAWVIGGPALKSGSDLNGINGLGQRDAYLASIGTDLKLLGFDPKLIDSPF